MVKCVASLLRYALCGIGGALLMCGLIVLTIIDQDDARHNFGHSGGVFSVYTFKFFHASPTHGLVKEFPKSVNVDLFQVSFVRLFLFCL